MCQWIWCQWCELCHILFGGNVSSEDNLSKRRGLANQRREERAPEIPLWNYVFSTRQNVQNPGCFLVFWHDPHFRITDKNGFWRWYALDWLRISVGGLLFRCVDYYWLIFFIVPLFCFIIYSLSGILLFDNIWLTWWCLYNCHDNIFMVLLICIMSIEMMIMDSKIIIHVLTIDNNMFTLVIIFRFC